MFWFLLDHHEDGLDWIRDELSKARQDIETDYAEYVNEQLGEYELELEGELLDELDRLSSELSDRENTIGRDADTILEELVQLNEQLAQDLDEFETQARINAQLNERLLQLSTSLIEFNSLSQDKQERMIINFSIVSLKKENGMYAILFK